MTIEVRFDLVRGDFRLQAKFSVPATGVSAVFGPSGSGKTSLLRAIAGLDPCPGGYLRIAGAVWQDGDRWVPTHRRSLGYVFQEPSLFSHLTVGENLEYGARRSTGARPHAPRRRTVELLGLGNLLDRRPDTLSGGEQQRVAIARALASRPRLLLMDEPLASLDRERKQEILPYIESLHRELSIPVLYVTHSHDEVARLADTLILLEAGRVRAVGPIEVLFTRLDLPLAHDRDAEALIDARVAGHDEEFHLTHLEFAGGRFSVSRNSLPLGAAVRLRLAASDVSLTLTPQADTSILNVFPATVETLAPSGRAQVTVRLQAAGVPLLARVTRKSAARLDLQPGRAVHVQAKSVALLA